MLWRAAAATRRAGGRLTGKLARAGTTAVPSRAFGAASGPKTIESAWGIPLTCADDSAATIFDGAVADYLGMTGDPAGKCAVAATMEPGFAMAMALEAFFIVMSGGANGRTNERVVSLRRRLQYLVDSRHCSFRERSFVAALHAWSDGRIREAAAILEGWLLEQPHDVLAVRVLHGESRRCGGLQGSHLAEQPVAALEYTALRLALEWCHAALPSASPACPSALDHRR